MTEDVSKDNIILQSWTKLLNIRCGWVLVHRVDQRSNITKITEAKKNLTQYIGGKFNHNFISIVIGSCASGIKILLQLTTLNVMGALSDLFYISMEICHRKFTLGNVGHTHLTQFPTVKGSITKVKVTCVTTPLIISHNHISFLTQYGNKHLSVVLL